jgi:hypothetical protein
MAENDAGRFDSIVAGLQRNSITLLSTSSGRWLTSVKKSIEEYLRTLHLKVNDETRTKISNGPWTVNEGEHFIILHGAEGGKSIKVASQITSLPPNRVAVVVKSRHVSALEGLSAKDHLRVKIDKTGQEKVLEVCHRILVVFGAPQIKAAEADNVKWSEDPVMVTIRKEKDVSLGLSIISRQVHSSSPVGSITLIRKIDGPPGSAASEKLKKFMHIQSVNGLLLDGLSSVEASEVIRCIEEGPVFLMVRPASKDWTKIGSPSTPIAGTPLGTPVRTPSGPSPVPPPQPPPPSLYKGVCRFNMRPFELKWIEKAVDVQLNTETLHLIPALITEPKSQQRKATIIGYADNHLVRSDTKGDLIVAVNGVEVLRKTPHEVKKMIRETRHGALVSLTLYRCEEGPRTLAENVYSDIVQSYRPAQDQDVVATHDDEDLGFEESQDPSLEPVVVPCYRAIPVYFTGSNRECNTRLYNMMTKADSTVDDRSRDEDDYLKESSGEEISSLSPTDITPTSDPPSLVVTSHDSPFSMCHSTRPSQLRGFSQVRQQSTSSNSPSPLSISHKMLPSVSRNSVRSADSSSSNKEDEPSLLTTKCVDDDWNPLPSLIHPPNSLDSRKWFLLQNVDYDQLQSKQITLCPLQELLYLKSNTICVYAINLEDLTLSPHTVYKRIYEFLHFFQLRHEPKGMQVVLVGAYDSQTEYGRTLDDKKLEWLHKHISKVLQNKCVNEVLLEDLQKKRIHLIPFDLANPDEKTSDLQHVINDCVNKYDLRVEPTSTGSEGTPQSLKQWPLFWKMVMEMSSYQHLISKEELRKLASKVLWIEDGPLFEQCLECLDQTSLLQVHGPDDNSGFLTSPDLIVKLIANLADPEILRGILQRASKLESAQLETFAYITEKGLQKTIQDLFGLSNGECASLVQWMKHLKIALPANSGATQDSSLFIPAITTSRHWLVRSDAFVSEEGVELFIELPESATLLFFHDLIVRLLPQTGQKEALILDRACAKVRIPKLSLLPCYPMFDVVLQYSTIQSHIRVLIKPWQADLVSMAEKFFRDLFSEMDPSMQSHLIIGPRFDDPKALACARSRATFDFLDEVQQGPPSTSVEETSPTYVVNASALRQLISKGFEPKVAIESKPGYYDYFPVSKIPGLNQWVYDSRYLYGEKSEENKDLLLMRALSTVAEWLLPEPQTCASIACENGIVSPLGPEALSWAGNVGEPAAYKLIRMWQSRKLPISRLHDALVRHHHNAAASELAPFCHDVSKTATSP